MSSPPSLFARISPPRSALRSPYWLSILSALFGLVLRLAIDPWLGNQMPYITFLVAVALVGLFAGVNAAMLSTALGAVLAYFCFVPPRYQFGFQGVSDAAGFFSYLTAALCIVLLTGARKKAYAQAERRLQEQLVAQGKLRDAEKIFQLFMDNRPGFSYLRECNGPYVYFNSTARRLLGGEPVAMDLPKIFSELQRQDDDASKSSVPCQFTNKVALPEGERYWLTTKFTFANEAQQTLVGSVSTDITDQIRAEEVAIERERLLAATRMMATVAHEVNNPLAAVTGSVHLLGQEELSVRAKELANIAKTELSRLAHITRLVLGFYKENEHPIAADPCGLIKDVLGTVSSRLSTSQPQVTCEFGWEGTFAMPVRQAREVLENILGNSFESGATEIRIRVRRCNDWRDLSRPGCRISIIDDGHGMSSEDQKRAFEPFFSTKAQRGKGLGLWVSKAIVLKIGGTISLRTTNRASDHGTCISIFLPARISPVLTPDIEIRKDVQRGRVTTAGLRRTS
jgi:signal transduction histidine kinase